RRENSRTHRQQAGPRGARARRKRPGDHDERLGSAQRAHRPAARRAGGIVAKTVKKTEPTFSRPALAPGILAAIVLMAGVGFMDNSWFLAVHFVVTILAVIIGWFAIQAKQYWWLVVLIPIIVLWNPVFPLPLSGDGWF